MAPLSCSGKTIGWDTLLLINTPGPFLFSLDEDKSVQDFISAPTLADNFWLPVSSQAREEIRELQNTSRDLVLDPHEKDRWVYDWGATISHLRNTINIILAILQYMQHMDGCGSLNVSQR
jgi:hypothetical protein